MKTFFILSFFNFIAFSHSLQAKGIDGFWKSINDQTKKQESLVAIYEYKGKYFGRIILTYKDNGKINDTYEAPKQRAPGVKGNPFYSGMDIIWDHEPENSKYTNGKILDPEKGKVYDAEVWTENGNLIVRGEVLFFGKSEVWIPAKESDFPAHFHKPDLTKIVPLIHQIN